MGRKVRGEIGKQIKKNIGINDRKKGKEEEN